MDTALRFPSAFKWGVATAAHQVEGNNTNNDWWAWEQQAGHIKDGSRSALACNWWADAESDLDRAAAMGLNALRLSVEWSRIEPCPGRFSTPALERYAGILRGLRQRGLEPMVTLHHFTSPLWLAEQGGWENPQTVDLFARFAGRVVEALGPYCDLWCTVNEPNVYAYSGYLQGHFPPGKSDFATAMHVLRQMLRGHAAAYREIHRLQPQARVGLAHNMRVFDPARAASPLDRAAAWLPDRSFNWTLLTALTRGRWTLPLGRGSAREVQGTLDWFGLNYYTRDHVVFDRRQRHSLFARQMHVSGVELLDGNYGEFYSRGLYRFLAQLARLGLPILITENGLPDDDDDQRPRYLVAHLREVARAIAEGVPVQGYYHWTLVDNFEWAEGWTLRFGLIALNVETQERTPRKSAELYAEIARSGTLTPEMVRRHAAINPKSPLQDHGPRR